MLHLLHDLKTLSEQTSSKLFDLDNFSNLSLPIHVHYKDKKGKYIVCNNRTSQDVGFASQDDIKGLSEFDFNFLTHDQASIIQANDKAVFASGKASYFLEPFYLADRKKIRWY